MQNMPNITIEIKAIQSAKYNTSYLGMDSTWYVFHAVKVLKMLCYIYVQKTNVKSKGIRM